jgi:hypothetical protein
MAVPWRNCNASMSLLNAVNARWPLRDKASDGSIGDAEHASRDSDHNPWVIVNGIGVVRARDIDVDGIDAAWLAEQLRRAGAAGDARLAGGGYLILNRKMTDPSFSGWYTYTGTNPHTSHLHVSFSRNQAGFDSAGPWSFLEGDSFLSALTPAQQTQMYVAMGNCWAESGRLGDQVDLGTAVARIHHWLRTQPEANGSSYGVLANAIISDYRQTFWESDYAPAVNSQLAGIREDIENLRQLLPAA